MNFLKVGLQLLTVPSGSWPSLHSSVGVGTWEEFVKAWRSASLGLNQFESITWAVSGLVIRNFVVKIEWDHTKCIWIQYDLHRCGTWVSPLPALADCYGTFYSRNLDFHFGLRSALLPICPLSRILVWCACVLLLKVTWRAYYSGVYKNRENCRMADSKVKSRHPTSTVTDILPFTAIGCS